MRVSYIQMRRIESLAGREAAQAISSAMKARRPEDAEKACADIPALASGVMPARVAALLSHEEPTEVAAALIWKDDRFLICRRPANKSRGLLWEFVGGKLEPDESGDAALIRECREELDVTLSVGKPFFAVLHEYPDITVKLTLYNAQISEGVPKLIEHCEMRWITPAEIPDFEFCPADIEILSAITAAKGENNG